MSLFGTLHLKLALQVLCESSRFVGIGVVQGCEGMGDIPGVLGDEQHRCMGLNSHGASKVSVIDAAGVKQVEHK